ncbi:MAG: LptE family protein [Candidatus Omnitrophica bacterium]|nr:LptE family protein [Candidatus Omnitrophota bacterium]
MFKSNPFHLLVCVSVMFLSGCGYTTSSNLAGHLKTIHVETFKNKIKFSQEDQRNIYLPLLEVDVRNAVIDRYLFDGNLKIAERSQADLVLRGSLIGYQRDPLRYTDSDDVQEYRVRIIVSLELYDQVKQTVMWSETGFAGEADYFVTGSQASTEESAVKDATIDLARRIVERTIENW